MFKYEPIKNTKAAKKPKKPVRPAAKIIEGLKEALAVAKGEAEPHAVHVRAPKKQITLRLDPDVIEKFKATGPGWQARMNEALRKATP